MLKFYIHIASCGATAANTSTKSIRVVTNDTKALDWIIEGIM